MTTLGFTGTRSLGETVEEVTRKVLEIPLHDRYVTGGCVGFDHLAGMILARYLPECRHTVILPADRSRVVEWYTDPSLSVEVIEMPPETTYKDRNQAIVDLSDCLFYCALLPEVNTPRSGTWQTVRLARAKGIPISGMILRPNLATDIRLV